MLSFIFGLLLASVTGVTVLAFKHPHGFARLFPYLLAVVTVLFLGVTTWHIAIEFAWEKMFEYLVEETLTDAENVIGQLRLPYAWLALWYLGVVLFLWGNLKLPAFLQESTEKSESTDEQNHTS